VPENLDQVTALRPVGLDEEVAFANVGRRGSYAVGVGCATAAREAKLPPVF
jgi:hypothetical protein